MEEGDVWIFGYGSLVWRAGFDFAESHVAYIEGYQRRFWQSSTDHRGTEEYPGRVATLVQTKSPSDRTWGRAYKVLAENWPDVRNYLDYREKGGYSIHRVAVFHSNESEIAQALVYMGTSDNPHFVGPEPLDQLAHRISVSRGPSGVNSEYLFELYEWMRQHVPHDKDDHLAELYEAVRAKQRVGHSGEPN